VKARFRATRPQKDTLLKTLRNRLQILQRLLTGTRLQQKQVGKGSASGFLVAAGTDVGVPERNIREFAKEKSPRHLAPIVRKGSPESKGAAGGFHSQEEVFDISLKNFDAQSAPR